MSRKAKILTNFINTSPNWALRPVRVVRAKIIQSGAGTEPDNNNKRECSLDVIVAQQIVVMGKMSNTNEKKFICVF